MPQHQWPRWLLWPLVLGSAAAIAVGKFSNDAVPAVAQPSLSESLAENVNAPPHMDSAF
ncbi:MAG: hypothetical protein AAFW95_09585 [Cyanobacteria bacterium J06638_6]